MEAGRAGATRGLTAERRRRLAEALLVIDEEGLVVEAPPLAPRVLGVEISSLVGERLADLVAEEDRAAVRAAVTRRRGDVGPIRVVTRLRGGGTAGSVELRFHADGSTRPAGSLVVLRALPDSDGLGVAARMLRRITEIANDTSDPQLALSAALEDLATTLGWTDGRIVDLTAHEPGTAGSELQGENLGDAVTGAVLSKRACVRPAGGPDERLLLAIPVAVDGEVRTVLELSTSTLRPLDETLVGMLTDIGRQLGHVVRRADHLAQLSAVSAELERSNAELERFAYVASHDLQEPLRKIIGFAELLDQKHADALDVEGSRYLAHVVEAARRQKTLISDLLAYSRVDRRSLAREPVDLGELCALVCSDLAPAIEEAGATIDLRSLPVVSGDRSLLGELLLNLVSNAVKYRRADGRPHIVVSSRQLAPGLCEVSVADDGIGIAPEYREQVFEVFRRLHTRTEYSGSGIGLAICRKIVEQHGGRIWVEEPLAAGADIRFSLPLATPEERA